MQLRMVIVHPEGAGQSRNAYIPMQSFFLEENFLDGESSLSPSPNFIFCLLWQVGIHLVTCSFLTFNLFPRFAGLIISEIVFCKSWRRMAFCQELDIPNSNKSIPSYLGNISGAVPPTIVGGKEANGY